MINGSTGGDHVLKRTEEQQKPEPCSAGREGRAQWTCALILALDCPARWGGLAAAGYGARTVACSRLWRLE